LGLTGGASSLLYETVQSLTLGVLILSNERSVMRTWI